MYRCGGGGVMVWSSRYAGGQVGVQVCKCADVEMWMWRCRGVGGVQVVWRFGSVVCFSLCFVCVCVECMSGECT